MDQPAITIEQQKAPQILMTPEGQLFQLLDNKGLLLLIPLETYEDPLQHGTQHPSNQPRQIGPIQPGQGGGFPDRTLVLPETDRMLLDDREGGIGEDEYPSN